MPHPLRFLDLPYDIRYIIYRYTLISPTGSLQVYDATTDLPTSQDSNGFSVTRRPMPELSTAILRLNKQIYTEASHVLHTGNTLVFHLGDLQHPKAVPQIFRSEDNESDTTSGSAAKAGHRRIGTWNKMIPEKLKETFGSAKYKKVLTSKARATESSCTLSKRMMGGISSVEVRMDVPMDAAAVEEEEEKDEYEGLAFVPGQHTVLARFRELLSVLASVPSPAHGERGGNRSITLMLDNRMWTRGVNFGDRPYTRREARVFVVLLEKAGVLDGLKRCNERGWNIRVRGAEGGWDFDRRVWLRQDAESVREEVERAITGQERDHKEGIEFVSG